MKNLIIGLILGIVAGIIDTVPMIIQDLDCFAITSAFIHWMVLGIIIPSIKWDIKPWITGIIIAELTALPIMILLLKDDPKSIIPIFVFSAILGGLLNITFKKIVGEQTNV